MTRYQRLKQEDELFSPIPWGPWAGFNVRVGIGSKNYYVQSPRTNEPNPYTMSRVRIPVPPIDTTGADSSAAMQYIVSGYGAGSLTRANNKAYDRLIGNLFSARANIALTAIDYKKSVAMVSDRLLQIYFAVRAVKRFDFYGAARHLGVTPPSQLGRSRIKSRKGRSAQSASGAWLELQFGWLPLIQDIHDSVKVLASTPPSSVISGHGSDTIEEPFNLSPSSHRNGVVKGRVGVRHQMRVRCTNPNLLLLNQAGLVNPAYVLWDAVPFSFVVDWFLPVGKFLRSYTDFVGLEVLEAFTTESWTVTDRSDSIYNSGYVRRSTAWYVKRTLGVPSFRFPSEIQYKHGLWKQVTETALIVQKLFPVLDSISGRSKR